MSDVLIDRPELNDLGNYEFGWHDTDAAGAAAQRGLSEAVVRNISEIKNEPEWMLERRLSGLKMFDRKPMPRWGADLSEIDFDSIKYFVRASERQATTWEELPEDIRNTYERLGIPEAERQRQAEQAVNPGGGGGASGGSGSGSGGGSGSSGGGGGGVVVGMRELAHPGGERIGVGGRKIFGTGAGNFVEDFELTHHRRGAELERLGDR